MRARFYEIAAPQRVKKTRDESVVAEDSRRNSCAGPTRLTQSARARRGLARFHSSLVDKDLTTTRLTSFKPRVVVDSRHRSERAYSRRRRPLAALERGDRFARDPTSRSHVTRELGASQNHVLQMKNDPLPNHHARRSRTARRNRSRRGPRLPDDGRVARPSRALAFDAHHQQPAGIPHTSAAPTAQALASHRRSVVAPLAPERYLVKITIDRQTHDKLQRARDLLRHSIPNGDPAAIVNRALTILVAQLEKTQLAAAARPRARKAEPSRHTRHIPAAITREVWARDHDRCAFVGTNGRCTETGFLQIHHVAPFAAKGPATIENLELRCRAHNMFEAELFFGRSAPVVKSRAGP